MNMEQGSDDWYAARMGIPTASKFATVMAKGATGGKSKTRYAYMRKLAGEIITCEPMPNFQSRAMERGKIMEDEARNFYAFMKDAEPETVGFIRNGGKGASPDALLPGGGLLEIKTSEAHILIDLILEDEFPSVYKAQCQGQLWVAEREWLDLIVYWPKIPLFVKRIERDEEYIKTMSKAVDLFNDDLAKMVEVVRAFDND